jgi:hypothetical protein
LWTTRQDSGGQGNRNSSLFLPLPHSLFSSFWSHHIPVPSHLVRIVIERWLSQAIYTETEGAGEHDSRKLLDELPHQQAPRHQLLSIMGGSLSKLFSGLIWGKKDIRILILGLVGYALAQLSSLTLTKRLGQCWQDYIAVQTEGMK